MPDYEKMYAVLCSSVDGVIEPLRRIPGALYYAELLQKALLEAEEIYIGSAGED